MFRDGARKSIWQQEIRRFSAVATEEVYDVAVIGGGITGVTTACALQHSGKKCIILEANNIGFGTSGGTTAHINSFFDTTFKEAISKFGLENAQLLAKAGKEAMLIIERNVLEYNIACDYMKKTAQLFALDEVQEQKLADIVDGALRVGHEMEYIQGISYPIPFKRAVAIRNQAQFHPVKYIKALCDVFISAGGIIMEDCLCESHEEKEGRVYLSTAKGTIEAEHAIYATHIPPGMNLLHFTTAPYRSYAIAFSLKNNSYPRELGYDLEDPYHYYRSHVIDGKELLIAGGEDHKTGHADDTGVCFSNLENYCRQYFDIDRVAYSWSSQYYEPADGLPSIGKLPGSSGRVYVSTGFRGNGMVLGSLSSKILSDLIIRGTNIYEKLFNPSRFKPGAGFTSFIRENASVVHDFIKDKVTIDKVRSLGEIKEGEARVVKYEGVSYAVYKEQGGEIHLLRSTCPHARCEVRWNNAELSWDCPCHGSRFNINGRLLNAPATKGLDRLDHSV
ncbi:MAG: FAD-dependent oxidoreductase [Taibaiella sp.]|nr:FAD-dependent oxidoreductase [Taibaiella sp.]